MWQGITMDKIKSTDLGSLFDALIKRGYHIIGPTVENGAIVYDELKSDNDLPIGYTDIQDAGKYRLKRRKDKALFVYVVGPDSWKKVLHKPVLTLWSAKKNGKQFEISTNGKAIEKYAFFGVRACEVSAIEIQDKVFMGDQFQDTHYMETRKKVFIIAVNCTVAGGNCFCTSMNTGPQVKSGFDIALTEVLKGKEHYFVVEAGTDAGQKVLADVSRKEANEKEIKTALNAIKKAEGQMGRTMDTTEIKELLYRNTEHPHWDEVARRCLSCANCTMVCPTCFCTTVEDVTDLTGDSASRIRKWDSCFFNHTFFL